MSRWFCSIRSKVWLCVSIALLGYFIATVVGFYVNITQYQRLSHLQRGHIPLVTHGDRLLNLFEQQIEELEDAFLTGEFELAHQAEDLSSSVIGELDILIQAVDNHSGSLISVENLHILKKDYLQFIDIAVEIQLGQSLDNLSFKYQQRIQQVGKNQQHLHQRFAAVAKQLNTALVSEIEQNKSKALNSTVLLAGLFMVVLLVVALFVGRVSAALLVSPLAAIRKNIEQFEHGFDPQKPQQVDRSDEVGQLAFSFWQMTERLNHSMVSKRYVENIISNMSGALVVIRSDLTITKVNQQALQMFGYCEQDLLGQSLEMLIECGDDPQECRTRIDGLLHGQLIRDVDACCVNKDGKLIPAHFSGSAMYGDNSELAGIICVFNDVTELKEAEEKLKQMAHHDPLTGLPNRNLFFDRFERALLDGKRHGRIFALLYLDLDKFKPINDTLGHEIGDLALKEVSNRLLATLRGDDTVARVGGDEFIIILNGLQSMESATTLARKVVETVSAPLVLGSLSHHLGVSVGISIFPQDGTSMDTLIATADAAMYEAKECGGNAFSGGGASCVRCDR